MPVPQNACSRVEVFAALALFTLLMLQKMEDIRESQIQPITYTDNNHPLSRKKKGSERTNRKASLENPHHSLRSSVSFHQRGISNAICCLHMEKIISNERCVYILCVSICTYICTYGNIDAKKPLEK